MSRKFASSHIFGSYISGPYIPRPQITRPDISRVLKPERLAALSLIATLAGCCPPSPVASYMASPMDSRSASESASGPLPGPASGPASDAFTKEGADAFFSRLLEHSLSHPEK